MFWALMVAEVLFFLFRPGRASQAGIAGGSRRALLGCYECRSVLSFLLFFIGGLVAYVVVFVVVVVGVDVAGVVAAGVVDVFVAFAAVALFFFVVVVFFFFLFVVVVFFFFSSSSSSSFSVSLSSLGTSSLLGRLSASSWSSSGMSQLELRARRCVPL